MDKNYTAMDTKTEDRRGRCMRGVAKVWLFVAVAFASLSVSAQQDVVVTVQKMRQYLPSTLTELIDRPNQYVSVTLTNITNEQQKIYLKMSLTSEYAPNGEPIEVHTQDNGTWRPSIVLAPHETRVMNQIADFSEHFSGHRLSTNATSDLMNLNRLPEGNYEFCMEAYRWAEQVLEDGDPMSRSCVTFNVCYTGSAPEMITPIMTAAGRAGEESNVVTPARILTLRWTGVITNCPQNSRFNYVVKIVKVPANTTPEYAISHAPVVFSRICRRRFRYWRRRRPLRSA